MLTSKSIDLVLRSLTFVYFKGMFLNCQFSSQLQKFGGYVLKYCMETAILVYSGNVQLSLLTFIVISGYVDIFGTHFLTSSQIRYKGIKLSQYKTVYIKKHQLGSSESVS